MNHDDRWNQYLQGLTQYTERTGTSVVPVGHVEFLPSGTSLNLGNWVSYMRSRYHKGALTTQRLNILEGFPNWEWGPVRPGPKLNRTVSNRNQEIINRYKESSVSLSHLAKEYNLTKQRVHQIVKDGYAQQ